MKISDKFCGVLLLSLFGSVAMPAIALAQEAAAEQKPDGAESRIDSLMGDIVVTARKREESAQSIPLAISAFSGDAIAARGVQKIDGLATFTPNMTLQNNPSFGGAGSSAAIYIRGIGQKEFLPTTEPGVGVYVDGVYVARSVGALLDLVDIERVEILRGPQGTLFGRNTIGGAISITTRKPNDDPSGSIQVTTGRYSRIDAKAIANLPISDTVFSKLSVATFNRDGYDTLISTDMGGTSFDIGYVDNGRPSYALRPEIEGFACNLPMMAIDALGAGGGSIAAVVKGELRVGPQSAGALPGPACFGLGGTKATVTDANLVLGILDPDHFLGGGMKLDLAKARAAIESDVAGPLGISVEDAALAIRRTVEKAMGEAVSAVADRLKRPDGLPVVAYGGAGAIHAADIAAIAGIEKVIITPFSAVSSAFGSSLMDVGHIYYRRAEGQIVDAGDIGTLAPLVDAMEQEGVRDMRGEGFDPGSVSSSLQLFWSNAAGDRELMTSAPTNALSDAGLARGLFDDAAAAMNGHGPVRLASVAYFASAPVPHFQWQKQPTANADVESARRGERTIWFGGDEKWVVAPVYDRALMGNGHKIDGPAIAESSQTTILVPSGWSLRIDDYDNALLERA